MSRLPAEGLTLADKIAINKVGAAQGRRVLIREVNIVRRHLSAVERAGDCCAMRRRRAWPDSFNCPGNDLGLWNRG